MHKSSNLPKRIHITGICGVGTSALAIALHKKGVLITGSDKGFFPPVSTSLELAGISFYAGWHPEKMITNGIPELIIAGGSGTALSNPELAYAKDHSIELLSMAEAISQFLIKENSIVCTGTWGKSTSAGLLQTILSEAGLKPSYFAGGVMVNGQSAEITDSKWSVVEGDEYQSAIWDKTAKFSHYKPNFLLLSAVSWDHADLYPTQADYFNAFTNLVDTVKDKNGFIVACADNDGVIEIIKKIPKNVIVSYGSNKDSDFQYGNVVQNKESLTFSIFNKKNGLRYQIKSPLLGSFQAENITGCFALALSLSIPAETIIESISKYNGLKRRLERRLNGSVTVIDDIAHSPDKARSVLKTLNQIYRQPVNKKLNDGSIANKVVAIFEPNIGGRSQNALQLYANAFEDADEVIIPRLSKLKIQSEAVEGDSLAKAIALTHKNVHYIEDDKVLVEYVCKNRTKGDIIVFLGSHGWRGMIEEVVHFLENSPIA